MLARVIHFQYLKLVLSVHDLGFFLFYFIISFPFFKVIKREYLGLLNMFEQNKIWANQLSLYRPEAQDLWEAFYRHGDHVQRRCFEIKFIIAHWNYPVGRTTQNCKSKPLAFKTCFKFQSQSPEVLLPFEEWDQYSLTSCPNSDPSSFISFIGSSYSTNFPIEAKAVVIQIGFAILIPIPN